MISAKTNSGSDNINVLIQSIPLWKKSITSVKTSEEPGTFETVLNSLLTANTLPTFKMDDVTPPTSLTPTSTDTSSLNTTSLITQ